MERMVVSHRALSPAVRVLLVGSLLAVALTASPCRAYSPSSPEVIQMVNRAVAYLKKSSHTKPGGWALIGLTLVKNRESLGDPKIVEAAQKVSEAVHKDLATMDIYSTGLSVIFLTNYDSGKYRGEINMLLNSLVAKQKPHGGWGYPQLETGDTSMTQYGVLGSWEAKQAGFDVPQRVIDRVATWLMRTQDPSGAWGYQGQLSENAQLRPQQEIRPSLCAAGLGSVFICADLLGMTPAMRAEGDPRLAGLREIKEDDEKDEEGKPKERVKTTVNLEAIRATQARGNGWFQKNEIIDAGMETLYYMYALERYQSFRELAEGRAAREKDTAEGPKWYNAGVEFLKKTQAPDGSWSCQGQCDTVVNTAFGALFLLRSSQKSIRRARGFGDGRLIGGVGLPKEGEEFLGSDGRVVSKSPLGPFAAMKAELGRQSAEDLQNAIERIEQEAKGRGSDLLTSDLQKQFRELLADPEPEKRIAAVKALVLNGNLDDVPMLILAMDDPDPEVMIAARDGLCRLTRRFSGFGPPDDATPEERRLSIERWKQWYKSIRPDTEF